MSHDEGFGSGNQGWAPQPQGYPTQGQPTPGYPTQGYPTQGYPTQGQPPQASYPGQPTYPQPGYPVQPGGQPGYPGGQPGYAGGQPGYYGQPAPKKSPALAIVGLVLAFLIPPVGLILSIVAAVRAKKAAGAGKGLAIGGIVVGSLLTILGLALLPFIMNAAKDITGARSAFVNMQGSLVDGDCETFMANTTPRFQEQLAVFSCNDFQVMIDEAAASPVGFGNVPVTGVEVSGDTATVSTLERVDWTDGGNPNPEPFDYTVVRRDGTWLVDWVEFGD